MTDQATTTLTRARALIEAAEKRDRPGVAYGNFVLTAMADAPDIARAKRREAKHLGARKPSTFRRPPGVRYDWRAGRYRQETT